MLCASFGLKQYLFFTLQIITGIKDSIRSKEKYNVRSYRFQYLGLLGWGAYAAGKAAWENRSTIARYASNFYNLPETTYQAVKVKVDRT